MRHIHPILKLEVVDLHEAEFDLKLGSFVALQKEFGWVIKIKGSYITINTLYGDKKQLRLDKIFVPSYGYQLVKDTRKGISLNGKELCRCMVCYEYKSIEEMSLVPNQTLLTTYAVCSGDRTGTDLGDCELQAFTAKRRI